jgi:tetratricopeptide (TPR) repeat protein
MPSLDALNKFKSSFNDIANERKDVESLSLPFNDLALPSAEAPPFNYSRENSDLDDGPDAGLGTDSFDFDSFLNDLPGDTDTVPIDTPPSDAISALDDFLKDLSSPSSEPEPGDVETSGDIGSSFFDDLSGGQEGASPFDDEAGAGDFSAPEGLLSGFSDEMESAPSDFQADDFGTDNFDAEDFGAGDFPAEDLGINDLGNDDNQPADADADFSGDDFGINDFQTDDLGSGDNQPADADADFSGDDFGINDFQTDDLGSGDNQPADTDADFSGDDFGAIDLGGESPYVEPDVSNDADFSGMDFESSAVDESTGENFDDSFGLGNDSIDMGGESLDFPAQEESSDFNDFSSADDSMFDPQPDMQDEDSTFDDTTGSDFDDPLSGMDFQEEQSSSDDPWSLPADIGDFSAEGEMDLTSDGGGKTDDFNIGDLGSDFESSTIELESINEELDTDFSGGEVFGNDDFSLSGIDEILNKSKTSQIPVPDTPKKGLFGKKKKKIEEEPEAEENIDEIALSQDEVDSLLRTLSLYPLNLRIACEELIAEQVILPQQLSKLIRLLVNGANVKETAVLVEEITGKPVIIPKSFEKMTGAAFEAEQSSFAYIFVHNFLPVLRLFAVIAALAASVIYLGYNFIYIPILAESIYKRGYERIPEGEYQRANELFNQAFALHRKKKWFYLYAEAFRDQRRFTLAEQKYEELLRFFPRDKKGVLDYAHLNTHYLMNFEKANRLLQRELLDYAPNDREGLLAAGDNFLAWADSNPARFSDRYEDARFSFARLLELYGWQAPVVERMMIYFIRTDNLRETLHLRHWFESSDRRHLSAESLAELGGYLLDKQLERPTGVPDPYIESIESVRAMLLQAVMEDPYLPEPHYHLARYHHNLGNTYEERLTLENAIRAFDLARRESVRRRLQRVDAHYRYANLLINNREFFPAEREVIRGIGLYEDFLNRNLIGPSVQLGQLYALGGDIEYFAKPGSDMRTVLDRFYHVAEGYGYAPPEILFRMGSAYYQLEDWRNSLEYLFRASTHLPLNRRMLFALGNVTYQRGDYFAAQGYYNRLIDLLENQRVRLPVLLPNDNPQFLEIGERLMMARNNAGVVYDALAEQTGNRDFRARAMSLYAESARAWDAITRNPETMIRMRLSEIPGAPGINLGYLNANNLLRPGTDYSPGVFIRIDRDVVEPSRWEQLAPFGGMN